MKSFQINATARAIVPVVETIPADLITPLGVFLTLSGDAGNCFLLESVDGGENLARYSFIGAEPFAIIRADGDACRLSHPEDGVEQKLEASITDVLRSHFADVDVDHDGTLPAFLGGAIGYLGFDCVDWFEPSLGGSVSTDPRSEFMIFRSVVAFDHVKQVVKLISLADKGDQDEIEAARARNTKIKAQLERQAAPQTKAKPAPDSVVTSNFEKGDFEEAVGKAKRYIYAGDCYQVVLSQRFSRRTAASDVSIYRALRSTNPSPYMFLLRFDDRSIIGASPEMLVRCTGRKLEYRPIAGTRPRGRSREDDDRLANEMGSDVKEVAEHMMLVDLGRNDLGRVAEFGSVKVDELMKVEKYSHVQHLVSALSATLRPDLDRFDALASCFPAGTVSGAPKVRSVEIIRELEPDGRGTYAGAVGYFDYSGNMDTCIAIRTLVLENGVAHVQAGAGIVADSVPEREWEETVNKAKALLNAIEIAESGRL